MPSADSRPRTTRVGWLPLLLAMVLIPLLLTALATCTPVGKRDAIQDDLTKRAGQALASAGIPFERVSFDGRDATVTGVPADQADAAREAVDEVEGVRVVDVSGGAGTGEDGTDDTDDKPTPISVAVQGDKVILSGPVPDQAAKDALLEAARAKAGGREVVDKLTVDKSVKPSADADGVGSLVAAAAAAGGDVTATADGDTVTLTGEVASATNRAAAEKALADAGLEVDNKLTVVKPFDKAAKSALQKRINAAIAAQPITFEPNTAALTAPGAKTVRKVAKLLAAASQAKIEVAGHVAAATSGSGPSSKKLSQQRADAVKKQLTKLGVAAGQITARGYGGSKPIKSNDTPEGQAANRRVEIVVL